MREYDGKTYRYLSQNESKKTRLEMLDEFLGFRPELDGLEYDFSFYSGGCGVMDKHYITCKFNEQQWESLNEELDLAGLDEIEDNDDLTSDILWLISGEESTIKADIQTFFNDSKKDFQTNCSNNSKIYFTKASGVNSWLGIWLESDQLNYIYFDQG